MSIYTDNYAKYQRSTAEDNMSVNPINPYRPAAPETGAGMQCCSLLFTLISWLFIILTFPFSLALCLKVVQEYQRAVIFRFGRLRPGGPYGPGLFLIVPCTDNYRVVDLRVVSYNVPTQQILSKDSVTIAVDAVVYYRIVNPMLSIMNVEHPGRSTELLAQTTLRNVLGTKLLAEMVSERDVIAKHMQTVLDEVTEGWGVKVERVEMRDMQLPAQLQRAMAAEAEAARDASAKVVAAKGEKDASQALREASEIMGDPTAALQLRYLQTLQSIATEKNSTIVFPLPMNMMNQLGAVAKNLMPPPPPLKSPRARGSNEGMTVI